MIKEEIKEIIKKAVEKTFKTEIKNINLEHPENLSYGDYSTNVAFQIAKIVKANPMEIASSIAGSISQLATKPLFENIKVEKPGFINFYLFQKVLIEELKRVLREKEEYGRSKIGKGKKVNVEFISANPTGPLTLGNGRGGFWGDVLSNVLEKAGYKVTREYYINDVGEQIKKLGHSVIGDAEACYKGKYIEELRKKVKGVAEGAESEKVGEKAAKIILKEIIKPAIKKMGIKFDVWFSEKNLYKRGEIKNVLRVLKKTTTRPKLAPAKLAPAEGGPLNLVYEKDGALWFKSTQFGDDKDRVLIKADGEQTYFLSDIAYLKNKFQRGFKKLIFIWGADHYGYIGRMKAVIQALGYKKAKADFIIMQLVRLFEKGLQVRMSKRTGSYITLEELIDEVGLDVARFFFLTRTPGSHLNFDLDLAKERSEKNPVYYVQYAHARICSILRKGKVKTKKTKLTELTSLKLLNHPSELNLIKQLIRFPEIIEETARDYQVQRLPQYAQDLATVFHQFYRDCKVLTDDKKLSQARLALILATQTVLKNTLSLMGISSPEKM